jgi:hypothetical protein
MDTTCPPNTLENFLHMLSMHSMEIVFAHQSTQNNGINFVQVAYNLLHVLATKERGQIEFCGLPIVEYYILPSFHARPR